MLERHHIRPEESEPRLPDQVLAHLTNRRTSRRSRKEQLVKEVPSRLFLAAGAGNQDTSEAEPTAWNRLPCEFLLNCSSQPADSSLPVKVSGGGQELHTLSPEEGFLDPTPPWLQSEEKRRPGDLILKPSLPRKLPSVTFSLKLIVVPSYSTSTLVLQAVTSQSLCVHRPGHTAGRSALQWFVLNNGLPPSNNAGRKHAHILFLGSQRGLPGNSTRRTPLKRSRARSVNRKARLGLFGTVLGKD